MIFKPFTFLKKMKRAWAKFLFLFLLPLNFIQGTTLSIALNFPVMRSVFANSKNKEIKNIAHNGIGALRSSP